jgi:hypothetical protein
MSVRSYYARCRQAATRELWADERAAQILEFALSLPLLMVFVVGIFDFSGALALKQKLTNAARESARVAAADPANDLVNPLPVSVIDAFQVVDNYLISEKIYDCGLALPSKPDSPLTWIAKGTSCGSVPPNGIILTINRGFVTQQTTNDTTTDLVSTQVTIQYAYKWRFNSVITLLVPKAAYASMSYITTTATAFNEN